MLLPAPSSQPPNFHMASSYPLSFFKAPFPRSICVSCISPEWAAGTLNSANSACSTRNASFPMFPFWQHRPLRKPQRFTISYPVSISLTYFFLPVVLLTFIINSEMPSTCISSLFLLPLPCFRPMCQLLQLQSQFHTSSSCLFSFPPPVFMDTWLGRDSDGECGHSSEESSEKVSTSKLRAERRSQWRDEKGRRTRTVHLPDVQ